MTRVLVCGSRDYQDEERLGAVLDAVHRLRQITAVIEGGAAGADALAHVWAAKNQVPVKTFNANWGEYGRAAGMIRNRQMLDEGHPDIVYAFTSKPLSESKGTAGMVKMARQAKVRTVVVGQDDSEYVIAEAEELF